MFLTRELTAWLSDFSNRKPVEIIDTRKTRTVLVEIEQGWWMALCVNFTKIQSPISQSSSVSANGNNSGSGASRTKNSIKTTGKIVAGEINGSTTANGSQSRSSALSSFRRRKKVEMRTDYSRKEVPGCNVLHSQLIRGYNQWKMLYGRYPGSYVRDEKKENALKESRRLAEDKFKLQEQQEYNEDADSEASEARDVFDEDPVASAQQQADNAAAEQALDELAQFRMNLRKFWSWWLHKWELYTFSSATWGGTLNNSFLAHGLTLGSVPTLSFSFMDYAVGIKMGGPGRISDLTAEAVRAIVKREERNGMVDLVITRLNTFSVVAPGGSLLKSSATATYNGDSASLNGDAESIYSRGGDDAASIMSSRSRRSRFFDKRTESVAGQSEYTATSDSDTEAAITASLLDEEFALKEEMRNGCVFQGVGYISRTSVAEYSRWLVDNHIFPSPAAVEGVRWSLYSNIEDPLWPFSSLIFSFKYGYRRPTPPKPIKKKKKKQDGKKRGSVVSISGDNASTKSSTGITNNSNNSAAAKYLLDSSLGLLSKVASGSTASTAIPTLSEKPHEIKDDLSDAKFLVGLQGGLDMDGMFDDDDDDDADPDDEESRRAPPEITTREIYVLKKRRKNRDAVANLAQKVESLPPPSLAEVEEEPSVTPVPVTTEEDFEGDTTIGDATMASIATITADDADRSKDEKLAAPTLAASALADSTSTLASTSSTVNTLPSQSTHQKQEQRLLLVIYKRVPFIFSAFFDPEKSEQSLSSPDYYKSLHLRLGTLVEPIFEDLEKSA